MKLLIIISHQLNGFRMTANDACFTVAWLSGGNSYACVHKYQE